MNRPVLALAALSLATATMAQTPATLPADQAAMRAHVAFLASDALKGREAGTPEYDIAAHYVAAQFQAVGLRPAGDAGGYLQAVPLVGYKLAGEGRFVWSPANGAPISLQAGVDHVAAANPAQAATGVEAPVVFVGYGLEAPAYGIDDYAGVDVRGKIVAFVGGSPDGLPGDVRATFGDPAARLLAAGRHGAVGAIAIADLRDGGRGTRDFAATAAWRGVERITWATPSGAGGTETPGTPLLGTLSTAGAAKVFGRQWSALREAASGKVLKGRPITAEGTLSVTSATRFRAFASSNVVGMIPGADPALAAETVVLSAHLDHIGITAPVDGDTINNGAMDDAIGIASLIEVARRFSTAPRPRRSIVFLAVTAEEKGLVGSDYFVAHPPVPVTKIVADVNLDMPILTYRFEDMVAFGGDRSTLGPVIGHAVAALGVTLSPDPNPEQAIFVRSDHFRFVQRGIPSVFLWPGPKGPGKAATDTFMATRYHKPSDDLTQPILWDQGVRFVDANYRIAREIADADARPVWNRGDYFGTLYRGPLAH